MNNPTINVAIALRQLLNGAGVARARVKFEPTGYDVDAGLVLPVPTVVVVDDNGDGTAPLWSSSRGTQGSQVKVTCTSELGALLFEGTATLGPVDCNLHEVLDLLPPPSVDDAQRWTNKARDWAVSPTPVDGSDSAKTSADKAHADRLLSDADVVSTGTNVAATAADVVTTAANVVQTGLDRVAADTSAQTATGFALTAVMQATLAAAYASSAASAAQQDLSGVVGGSLHRSPNAVTSLFVYDTSKDSDGGAWVERMADRSWMAEALNGAWLGAQASETHARFKSAPTGAELTSDPELTNPAVWATVQGSIAGGRFVRANNAGAASATFTFGAALTANQLYRVDVKLLAPAANPSATPTNFGTVFVGGQQNGLGANFTTAQQQGSPGDTLTFFVTPSIGTVNQISAFSAANTYTDFESISVKAVTGAPAVPSGAYYQSAVDGKFYRLWPNLLDATDDFTKWSASGVVVTADQAAAPTGAQTADLLTYSAANFSWVQRSINSTAVAASTPVTGSVVLKPGTLTGGFVQVGDTTSTNTFFIRYTVAGGIITLAGSGTSGTGVYVGSTVTLDPVSGGYRITVSGRFTSAVAVGILLSNNTNGAGTIYASQAQLEYGASFTTYDGTRGASGTGLTSAGQDEVFRGNVAKFPRLSAIVAEAARVVIYDLTNPGRPMWMVFLRSSTGVAETFLSFSGTSVSSVYAVGGMLCVGLGTLGLALVNFAADRAEYKTAVLSLVRLGTIAQRNVENVPRGTANGGGLLANATVNAVAMVTMPDAPVDPVTGLQVPTIAVATAGGVSVMKSDGTVVNSSSTSNFSHVDITPRILTFRATSPILSYVLAPASAGASFVAVSISQNVAPGFQGGSAYYGNVSAVRMAHRGLVLMAQVLGADPSARVSGLRLNESNPNASLAFGITNTYNTGWTVGDIRRTLLCDTVAGNVTGANLVTNGGFDLDANWTKGTGWAIAAGKATKTPGTASLLEQTGYAFVIGQQYEVVLTVSGRTAGALNLRVGNNTLNNLTSNISANGTQSFYVTVTNIAMQSLSVSADATFDGSIDDVSVRLAAADRSYKARGVGVYGTLTKAAVGVGSQLVAYSGFSAANYVQEPYSADLDVGTGGFDVLPWLNLPAVPPQFPTGVELRATGSAALIGAATAASYDTVTGNGSVSRVDVTNQSYVSFAGLSGTYWVSLTNTGANIILVRTGGSGGTPPLSIAPGQTLGGHVASQAGAISITSGAGTSTFTGLSIKQETPCYAVDRSAAAGAYYRLGTNADGTLVGEVYDGTNTRTVTTTASYNGAGWIQPELSLSPSGSLTLKVNGAQIAQTTGAPLLTLNNAAAVLTVGNNFALTAPFPGSIALLRIGATIPSDEAATFMYQQEHAMFRDGAQVTLPDSGTVVDLAYDPQEDKVKTASAANESSFVGLVRTGTAPVPAGSFAKVAHRSGVRLMARSTTNPGADVTVPAANLMAELLRRGEEATRNARGVETFEWSGGFNASITLGATLVSSSTHAASLPSGATFVGAQISGTGVPAGATMGFVQALASQFTLSAPGTATTGVVALTFNDFILPLGYEPRAVYVSVAGTTARKREGASLDYTVLWDGYRNRVRFATAPGATAVVTIDARKVTS
jgi:hypothetical protein